MPEVSDGMIVGQLFAKGSDETGMAVNQTVTDSEFRHGGVKFLKKKKEPVLYPEFFHIPIADGSHKKCERRESKNVTIEVTKIDFRNPQFTIRNWERSFHVRCT